MDISVEEIPLKGTVCSVVITFLIFEKNILIMFCIYICFSNILHANE